MRLNRFLHFYMFVFHTSKMKTMTYNRNLKGPGLPPLFSRYTWVAVSINTEIDAQILWCQYLMNKSKLLAINILEKFKLWFILFTHLFIQQILRTIIHHTVANDHNLPLTDIKIWGIILKIFLKMQLEERQVSTGLCDKSGLTKNIFFLLVLFLIMVEVSLHDWVFVCVYKTR